MRILALDSSGLVASVAIVDEEQTLAEFTINMKMTHSQTLLPMLETIERMASIPMESIDAIAVSGGPGSFTGLRIGSATAKGLGLALDRPVIHVPTLEGIACNLFGRTELICPIMDARRNQVYTGLFHCQQEIVVVKEQVVLAVEELIELLNIKGEAVVFLGDAVPVYKTILEEGLQVPFSFAPVNGNRQRAASIGALAFTYYQEGKYETAREHKPVYLRRPQAERERKVKEELLRDQHEKEGFSYHILEAEATDINQISLLEREYFLDSWSEKSLTDTLSVTNSSILVAKEGEAFLGYAIIYRAADEAELVRIAVAKDSRRQGVGEALLKALEKTCREHAVRKIYLEVRESNEEAISFYEHKGYKKDGVRKDFYSQPKEDAILYHFELL